MTGGSVPGLRDLISTTVREVVAEMVAGSVGDALKPPTDVGHRGQAAGSERGSGTGRNQVERVRITTDADLEAFTRQLLRLFENPKNRQDIRAGRLRFTLAGDGRQANGSHTFRRIESGAVTERSVAAAAEAGMSIQLGSRAVLTPLGREKARALGVHIERER